MQYRQGCCKYKIGKGEEFKIITKVLTCPIDHIAWEVSLRIFLSLFPKETQANPYKGEECRTQRQKRELSTGYWQREES